jgi:hypothetical protein
MGTLLFVIFGSSPRCRPLVSGVSSDTHLEAVLVVGRRADAAAASSTASRLIEHLSRENPQQYSDHTRVILRTSDERRSRTGRRRLGHWHGCQLDRWEKVSFGSSEGALKLTTMKRQTLT